jgi:hypothetical protein
MYQVNFTILKICLFHERFTHIFLIAIHLKDNNFSNSLA